MRAGVASIFSAEAGREAGFFAINQITPIAITATTASTTPPTILKKVFMNLSRVKRFPTFYGTIRRMVLSAILLAATLRTNVASVTKIYDRDYAKKLVLMLTEVIS